MMADLILRQLGKRKARTALSVVGVAIGIVLITTLSSLSEGITSVMNNELGMLSGKITISAEGTSLTSFATTSIEESLISEIQDMPGIERAAGIVAGTVPSVGYVFGVHVDDIDLFNIDVEPKEGRFPEEGEDELVIGYKYADASGLKTGDEIEIRSKKYPIAGVVSQTGTEADTAVITSFEPAQEILKMQDKVTFILAKPINADESQVLAEDISSSFSGIQALSDKDAARRAQNLTSSISTATFFLGGIAAFIAGVGIMNVMFMSVRERRKEIGIMKALGATTHEILVQVLLEAIAITLAGEAIGVALSLGTVGAMNSISPQMSAIITPSLLIMVTVFAVLLGVLSGLLPAREAAKLQPAVVLRYE